MGVILYHFPPSAPSRSALLVAKALGIDFEVKELNLFNKEQLNPDFLKVNPQHCVPTLVDGDFVLWESRAIGTYLVREYGKDNKLYPEDLKSRAVIDQRLYFDCGTLYPRIRAICFPVLFLGEIEVSADKKASLEEALGFLDIFLQDQNYVAENHLTIADIAIIASLSSIMAVGWDISPYSNIAAWFERCSKEISGYQEINQTGADMFGKAVKSKLAPGQI